MERLEIGIHAYDVEKPTIYITFFEKQTRTFNPPTVHKLVMWIREDKRSDIFVLDALNRLASRLRILKAKKKELETRDIFATYQSLFANEKWTAYSLEKHSFETERMAETFKPGRDFISVDREEIANLLLKRTQKIPH